MSIPKLFGLEAYRKLSVRQRLLISSVVLLSLLNFLLQDAISLTALLFLGGYNISTYVRRGFFKTYFSASLVGISVVFLFIGFFALILWFLRIDSSLSIIFFVSILGPTLLPLATRIKRDQKCEKFFDAKDLAVLAVPVLYFGVYAVGVIRSRTPDTTPKTIVVQNISFGVDDLSHLNMFKDTIEANKGLLLGGRDINNISKIDSVSYPKMSHLIGAVLANQANFSWKSDNEKSDIDYAVVYGIIKNLLFSIGIFFVCRAALEISIRKKVSPLFMASIALPLLAFIQFALISPFMQEGFFSVWPVILFMSLFVLLARDSIFEDGLSRPILVGLILSIILTSWPVMAVPLCVFIGILLIDHLLKLRKLDGHTFLKTLSVLFFGGIGLIQIYVQLFDKAAGIATSQLNAEGGIVGFPMLYILILNVLALYGIATHFANSDQKTEKTKIFYLLFVCILSLFVTSVGLLNIATTGSIQYFYIKSAYLSLIILCIFIAPFFVNTSYSLLGKVVNQEQMLSRLAVPFLFSALIVTSLFFTLSAESGYLRYMSGYLAGGTRHISSKAAKIATETDFESKNIQEIVNVDSSLETYYLSTLTRSLNRFSYCQGFINSFLSSGKKDNVYLCDGTDSVVFTVVNDSSIKDEVEHGRLQELVRELEVRGTSTVLRQD